MGISPIDNNTGNAYIVQDKNNLIPKLTSTCSTPTISISGTNSVCIGQSATITATGASSYTWSTTDTGATVILSSTVTTTYTVTGANTGACTATQTVIIIVNTLPIITVDRKS